MIHGIPLSAHSAPRVPPEVTASSRRVRGRASRNADNVSSVSPEYDRAITSDSSPTQEGSVYPRTGTTSVGRRAASRDPAIPDPPIPTTTTRENPANRSVGTPSPRVNPSRH